MGNFNTFFLLNLHLPTFPQLFYVRKELQGDAFLNSHKSVEHVESFDCYPHSAEFP